MKFLTKLTEDIPSLSQRPGARARPLKAGNPPKTGPEWIDSGRRTVYDCGTIDGCFSQIRPFKRN